MGFEKKEVFEFLLGINDFEILAVSPNNKKLALYGFPVKEDEAEYVKDKEKNGDYVSNAQLKLVIKQAKLAKPFVISWFITKTQARFGEKGDLRWINDNGITFSGMTKEIAIANYEKWQDSSEYKSDKPADYTTIRPLYEQEDVLLNLIKSAFKPEQYFSTKQVEDIFKGSFSGMDNILDTKFTGLFGEDDKGYPQLYTGAFGTSNIIKRIKGTPATDKFKGSKAFPFKAKYPTNFISCSNIGFIPTIGDNVAAVTGKTNETPAAPKSDNADLPF